MTSITKFTKASGINCQLQELLMGYTKTQLMEIAASFNSPLPKSWKKDKVAKALSEHIEEQAETIYQEVLSEVVGRLPNQEQSAYVVESLEGISSLNPLIEKGFIYIKPVNDSYMLIIPEEILEAAAAGDIGHKEEPTNETFDTHITDTLTKWKSNLENIYGTFSPEHLHAVWNRYYSQKLTIEEINDRLSN